MPAFLATFLLLILTSSALAEHQGSPCLICTASKFNNNGVINNGPLKTETGTINGVDYHFNYSDGNGSFGDEKKNNYWLASCKRDIFTDAIKCILSKDDIYVYVYNDKQPIVSIGHDHYHNSTVSVRFGTDVRVTVPSNNDGDIPSDISRDLIAKLINNSEVKTRYMELPYQKWIDKVTDTHGFPVAYAYLEWVIKQIADQQRLEEQLRTQEALAKQKAEEERIIEAARIADAERKAEMERKAAAEEIARLNRLELLEQKLAAEQKEQEYQKAQAEQRAKIMPERARAEQNAQAEPERAAQAAAIDKEVTYYTARIIAKIRRNIVMLPDMPYNARAEFDVTLLPGGMVLNAILVKPSGNAAYDSAVERAIKKAEPLPLPPDALLFNYFRELHLKFSPKE